MRKMSKTLLAMVLVITMVMSLMPMSFAVEGEDAEGVTIKYALSELLFEGAAETSKDYFNSEKTKGFYSIAAMSQTTIGTKYLKISPYNGTCGLFTVRPNNWLIFEINVPLAGTYELWANHNAKDTHGNLEAYIFPTTITANAAALSTEHHVGTLVCDSDNGAVTGMAGYVFSKDTAHAFKDGEKNATHYFETSGKYYIGMKVVSDGDASENNDCQFADFYLVGGDGYALIGDMTLSSDSVVVGKTATASAMAYKSDDASLATLTYASSNTNVATVDSATGVITAKEAGTTTITATAAGAANSFEKELEVTSAEKSGITIKYDVQSACAPDGIGKTESVDAGQNASDHITYDNTNGFFNYVADSVNLADGGNVKIVDEGGVIYVKYSEWLIFQLNVPVAGEYEIYVNNSTHNQGGVGLFYIFPELVTPDATALSTENYVGELLNNKTDGNPSGVGGNWLMTLDGANPVQKDGKNATYNFDTAGKYYMAIKAYNSSSITVAQQNRFNFGNIYLVGGNGNALMGGKISGVADELEIGDTATATASAYLSKDSTAAGNFTYSSDSSAITIDAATGALTANAEGKATITATSADALAGCNTITKTVTVKAAEPGEEVSDTMVNFTFVTSDAEAGSVSAEGYPIVGEVAIGTSVKATATANAGYEFAYWRNRAGTVLSTNATATFKFNTNTAVYAEFIELPDEDATEVPVYFYNGNGNLLESKNVTKGTTFGDAKIANPSMTGFSFMHWSDKDEEIAIADNTAINSIFRAVAIYGDSGEKYTVKADGSTVTSTATYGSEVTVTSSDANFVAWKLGDKVVSYDKAFTFYVWGDVELTSVTEGEEAPVAVLDEVDGNPMLIYSVPENCEIIEAGILFGQGAEIGSYESKAFAKESTGQFTAEPNGEEEDKTARGYLIFKKSGVIRVIYAD